MCKELQFAVVNYIYRRTYYYFWHIIYLDILYVVHLVRRTKNNENI